MPGTLYVVATPIGNLEDVTLRALRTLREVDVIAAEDTRRTSKLLAHYDIRRPLVSVREHNEAREGRRLVTRMQAGESVALVSDAGTPGISDPGARFVSATRDAGVPVVPIPGPSAVTAALSVAGLAADHFSFAGFPPSGGPSRAAWFDRLFQTPELVVFFESPHRIQRTVRDLLEFTSTRPIRVFREITKLNEDLAISPITSNRVTARGEFTVVVGPDNAGSGRLQASSAEPAYAMFRHLTNDSGIEVDLATTLVARYFGVAERSVRSVVKKKSILAKRQRSSSP